MNAQTGSFYIKSIYAFKLQLFRRTKNRAFRAENPHGDAAANQKLFGNRLFILGFYIQIGRFPGGIFRAD